MEESSGGARAARLLSRIKRALPDFFDPAASKVFTAPKCGAARAELLLLRQRESRANAAFTVIPFSGCGPASRSPEVMSFPRER